MKTLVLLVGSNPLPNYLTAMALKPERVLLVYSEQTKEPKDRLRDVLNAKGFAIDERCVPATDAQRIRDVLKSLPDDAHLNYTGGTKTMAAHARMALAEQFRERGGADSRASYLDEGGRNKDGTRRPACLRFDDGRAQELSTCDVSLTRDVLLQLHGITPKQSGDVGPPLPTVADVDVIRAFAIREAPPKREKSADTPTPLTLCDRLFRVQRVLSPDGDWVRVDWKQAKDAKPVRLAEAVDTDTVQLDLSIAELPAAVWDGNGKQRESRFERWQHFLHGGWLEEWVGDLCRTEMTSIAHEQQVKHWEVAVGLNCFRAKQQIEMDVLLLRDHRFYAISCTTDRDLGLCKLKLFEAAIRARQLGGDLARAALVCFLHGEHNKRPKVNVLADELAESWDAPNAPRVFGLEDLRTWMGNPEVGVAPNTESLRTWLES